MFFKFEWQRTAVLAASAWHCLFFTNVGFSEILCPSPWVYELNSHLCRLEGNALGPFPPQMVDKCKANLQENSCDGLAWNYDFAKSIRGNGICPAGTKWSAARGACQDESHVYGPFSAEAIKLCRKNGGGASCDSLRWSIDVLPERFGLQKKLSVPYFQQYSNRFEPNSTCNLTALAMVMNYWGENETPDELYESAGKPLYQGMELLNLARSMGFKGAYTEHGSAEEIKEYLNEGQPVILQGWFSKNGHFIVLTGYDTEGWIVNDPAGEWKGCAYCGYGEGAKQTGERRHYSFEEVENAATDGGNVESYWVTVVWKED